MPRRRRDHPGDGPVLRPSTWAGTGAGHLWAVLAVVALVCLPRESTGGADQDARVAAAATPYLTPAGPVGDGSYRHPAEVHTADGTYRFVLTRSSDGAPVTWQPCAPVPLVVNPEGAPAGAVALVREAAHQISAASGLDVRVVGTTGERPRTDRPLSLARYPGGFAPALVSWSDADESPGLENALAYADPERADVDGTGRWVTGQVVVDTDWLAGTRADNPSLPGEEDYRSVVLHELGHLVGLDHVSSQDELMYPAAWASELGPGDRAGLALLGAGACPDRQPEGSRTPVPPPRGAVPPGSAAGSAKPY